MRVGGGLDFGGVAAEGWLLDPDDCGFVLGWVFENGVEGPGRVNAQVGATRDGSVRVCREWVFDPHRVMLPSGYGLTERLYWGFNAGNFVGLSWETVPSVRLVEYTVGGFYRRHTDWSPRGGVRRKLSMTVQMSNPGDYEGGDVVLYAGPLDETVCRHMGCFAVWPSWVLHEVKEVTWGRRYALVAWAEGESYR